MDFTKAILCVFLCFPLIYGTIAQVLEFNSTNLPNHGICYSMDIRNHPKNLERLRNCSVIIGSLHIVLMTNDNDISNYVYPELREITQFLLLFNIKNMISIGKMFPNLMLIRGQRLYSNYALIIYQMPHLTEINLHSLVAIQRGSIRIESNHELCFIRTIDWKVIVNKTAGHFILDNGGGRCPNSDVCHVCEKGTCWNEEFCQTYPSSNCHQECLGGCTDTGLCYRCKNYVDNGICVPACPPKKYYIPASFECVTREFCNKMYGNRGWVFENQCIINCPIGYKQTYKKNGSKTCTFCGHECNVECAGSQVTSTQEAQAYRGCHFVNSTLIIKLFGDFSQDIIEELEDSFGGIKEIKGYLMVHLSPSISTLNFFKNLTIIHGDELYHDRYSLIITGMENLRTLWDLEERQLAIKKGFFFIYDNPALCMNEIRKLANHTGIQILDHDVSGHSNGNREPCHIKTLKVEISAIGEEFVTIRWERYIPPEKLRRKRGDFGYHIHFYANAIEGKTTHRYNTDGCSASGWNYIFIEDSDIYSETMMLVNLTYLRPFTTYAVYIQTFDKSYDRHIESNSEEGESDMIFFKTKLDAPPMPALLEAVSYASDELTLYWNVPPKYTNAIYHYTVELYIEYDNEKMYDMVDYCFKDIVWETPDKSPTYNIEEELYEIERDSREKCRCRDKNWQKQMDTIREQYEKENAEKMNKEEYCSKRLSPDEIGTYEDFLRGLKCGHIQLRGSGEEDKKTNENKYPHREKRGIKTRDNFDIRKLLNLDDIDLMRHPSKNVTINNRFHIYATNFSGSHRNFTIKGLKHFSKYMIMMAACTKEDGIKCSGTAVTSQRTLSNIKADRVKKLILNPKNESFVEVFWKKPKEPNGAVLYQLIQYRKLHKAKLNIMSVCISNLYYAQQNGKITLNLTPGEYEMRIRIATLGTISDSTDWHKVTLSVDNTWLYTLIARILIFLVISGIIITCYIYKLRRHQRRIEEERRNLLRYQGVHYHRSTSTINTNIPSTSTPSASTPGISDPCTSGPSMSGPSTSGPSASGPSASGPSTSGPSTSGASTSGPSTSGPSSSGPSTSAPVTSGPGKSYLNTSGSSPSYSSSYYVGTNYQYMNYPTSSSESINTSRASSPRNEEDEEQTRLTIPVEVHRVVNPESDTESY